MEYAAIFSLVLLVNFLLFLDNYTQIKHWIENKTSYRFPAWMNYMITGKDK